MKTPQTRIGSTIEETPEAGRTVAALFLGDTLPDLRTMAEKLARSCHQALPWAQVGVALPETAAVMPPSGSVPAAGNFCLMSAEMKGPLWKSLADDWLPAGSAGAISTGQGRGNWPVGLVEPGDGDNRQWQELVLDLSGQPVLVVLVSYAPEAGRSDQARQQLQRLGETLTPLLTVWSQVRRLEWELDRARTENNALVRLNNLQEKSVAMTSHEFKTPLTSITAYTDALRAQVTDAEFPHAPEFLGVIRTEAGRLLRMANRMLDFSRLSMGQELLEVGPENLEPLVRESVQALRPALSAKGLKLTVDLADSLPRVLVDADLVRQVLLNLLSNAVKYTSDGGRITLAVEEAASTVRVRVADTGMGIPESDLQRIFREFYRTKGQALQEEGSGLGLTIVRNIMNLHGGFVEVKRLPGGGTEFACHLPKEIIAKASLPLEFTSRADQSQAWRLISLVTCLAAELTDSLAVKVYLRDNRGNLQPVADTGPAGSASGQGHWLGAELGKDMTFMGLLKVGYPVSGGPYSPAVASQLEVIGHLAGLALSVLTSAPAVADGSSTGTQVAKVVEALRSILQIRRSGIPTSTAEALDLVDKLGGGLGVGPGNIRRLQYAALLHDAGMARVEIEIVMGESELTWDQRDEVDRHVEQGLDLMAPLLQDPDISLVIRHHHERVDGKGYPDGLKGGEIPLGARLLAVIDAWFALTRQRTFRPGLAPDAALAEIKRHSGTQFDAEVVQVFESVLNGEGILPASPAGNRN